MRFAAGDPGILIDFGNNKPGSVPQSRENPFGDVWRDYVVDGKAVIAGVDFEALPPNEMQPME